MKCAFAVALFLAFNAQAQVSEELCPVGCSLIPAQDARAVAEAFKRLQRENFILKEALDRARLDGSCT